MSYIIYPFRKNTRCRTDSWALATGDRPEDVVAVFNSRAQAERAKLNRETQAAGRVTLYSAGARR